MIDLLFPARGSGIRIDHSYALYGALSRILPQLHDEDCDVRFHSIGGTPTGDGKLILSSDSNLRLRLPDERIREMVPLAGKRLELDGGFVRLGVPSIASLRPLPRLFARYVTFKNAMEIERFLSRASERLSEMKIANEPRIPVQMVGEHAGRPMRRVMRIKEKTIVGFALIVDGLSPTDSLKLQVEGLGGRSHMGAGFFLPTTGVSS